MLSVFDLGQLRLLRRRLGSVIVILHDKGRLDYVDARQADCT